MCTRSNWRGDPAGRHDRGHRADLRKRKDTKFQEPSKQVRCAAKTA
jgi:hypothetical protein